jgi:RNA polymerase sigma factor (sigma-70 family)
MSEELFINLLRQGNQQAYRSLLDQFGNKVFNSVLGFLQNQEDAEDVTQEIFTEIFQSIHHFKEKSSISTWIYRITVNKSIEFIRKKNRQKRFSFFQLLDTVINKEIDHFHHPGVQLQNKEQSAILFSAINKLPEKQKTAFILHKLEDLSYVQIAEVMKVTLSSVESLMFRAKQNLQTFLKDYYEKNIK